MATLIVPLTKSPHPKGRVGPDELQDWRQGLRKAVAIKATLPGSDVLVLSNVHVADQPHEADLYSKALSVLGLKSFRVIRECQETIEQINKSFDLAMAESKDLIFVSTFLHHLRVQWLIFRHPYADLIKVRHYAAFGIPRPKEAVTDIILTFLFPVVDILGYREKFLSAVNKRRISGKH